MESQDSFNNSYQIGSLTYPDDSQFTQSQGNRDDDFDDVFGTTTIWGTRIQVKDAMEAISNFVTQFNDRYYLKRLLENLESDMNFVNIDCQDLAEFSEELYENLVLYPTEMLPLFDVVLSQKVTEAYEEMGMELEEEVFIQTRPYNLKEVKQMRDVSPSHIGRLISIKGMVIRTTEILPDLRVAHFSCTNCGAVERVPISRGKIEEPTTCGNCGGKFSFKIIHNLSEFSDKQIVKLQEIPDNIPEGGTPQILTVMLYDDLVDIPKPGDKLLLTGIYRVVPVRKNARQRTVLSVFRSYVDVVHLSTSAGLYLNKEDKLIVDENVDKSLDEQKRERMLRISQTPDIVGLLVESLAPSIFGLEDVKRGILCQLFGGSRKEDKSKLGRIREHLNILLVGDPGTAKSQLLKYVNKISTRGVYTSGKGSSSVGLTAYITKDPDTGSYALESGALVLSDGGICCIDEFDKMSDQTRAILHEAMEQQTVSVTKAGIITTLNARTSILASANPIDSRYNDKLSVVQNIRLSPTLLSRFDLIYLILDKPDEKTDRLLAHHIINLFVDPSEREEDVREGERQEKLSTRDLIDYIEYARNNCNPAISDQAKEELVNSYLELRSLGKTNNTISATPRQLESLIRIAEALAKMQLKDEVSRSDVREALRLMKTSMKMYAIDPESGYLDMDMIATGISTYNRRRVNEIIDELTRNITRYIPNLDSKIRFKDIVLLLRQHTGVEESEKNIREALKEMNGDRLMIMGNTERGNFVIRRLL